MKIDRKTSIKIILTIALFTGFTSITNPKFVNALVFDGSDIGQSGSSTSGIPVTQQTHQGDNNLNNQQQTHQGDHNFNKQQFEEYRICLICIPG
jgi:hypothetical protein